MAKLRPAQFFDDKGGETPLFTAGLIVQQEARGLLRDDAGVPYETDQITAVLKGSSVINQQIRDVRLVKVADITNKVVNYTVESFEIDLPRTVELVLVRRRR